MSRAQANTPRGTYEFRLGHPTQGWWPVLWAFTHEDGPRTWEVVARVFGEKRAEIVRDALSAEANERA